MKNRRLWRFFLHISQIFRTFATEYMKLRNQAHKVCFLAILFATTLLVACQPQPQKARHLSQTQELDSVLLKQMEFNTHMAEAADKVCLAWVQADSLKYTMDDLGFWYTKTIKKGNEVVEKGQEVTLHIQIREVNGKLLSDVKHQYVVGNGELPTAIRRILKIMGQGEQMQIVTPWYAAYGVEGTSIIKPYSNLIILLTIEE